MPSGKAAVAFSDLLMGHELDRLVEQWRQRFDIVLIHAPQLAQASSAQAIAQQADAVILVSALENTGVRVIATATSILDRLQAQLMGVIVTANKNEGIVSRFTNWKPSVATNSTKGERNA